MNNNDSSHVSQEEIYLNNKNHNKRNNFFNRNIRRVLLLENKIKKIYLKMITTSNNNVKGFRFNHIILKIKKPKN